MGRSRARRAELHDVLVGYSHERDAFVAYAHASEWDFVPSEVPGMFLTPTPWTMAPHGLEVDRFLDGPENNKEAAAQMWEQRPRPVAPESIDAWRDLAITVRTQRALEHYARTIVAGQVIHTRLTRGQAHTQTIHRFNDAGEEFNDLIRWTQHPQALAMNCHCGSSKTFGDCCGNMASGRMFSGSSR